MSAGTAPRVSRCVGIGALAVCGGGCSAPDGGGVHETDPPACDAPPASTVGEGLDADLRAVLGDWLRRYPVPGIVAGVVLPDGRRWTAAAGVADVDAPEDPLTTADALQVGSITKTFVTATVLRLVDEGRLDLAATVDAWYPDLPNADRLTVLDLLQHGSGLRDYTALPAFVQMLATHDETHHEIDELIALAGAAGADFEPGSRWAYSNTNFFVAGRIAERVTGRDLVDLLHEHAFAPAGLGSTWLWGYEPVPPCTRRVAGHLSGQADFPIDPSWQWASGGIAGTVDDQLAWIDALLASDDVLDEASRARMTTPSGLRDGDGAPAPYGTGLYVRSRDGHLQLGHTGSTMGFRSDLYRTDDGIRVSVLQNDFRYEATEVADALVDLVRDEEAP